MQFHDLMSRLVVLDAKSEKQCVLFSNLPHVIFADFDIVDPTDPLRATPGGGPHPDYLLESPMSDGTIEEDFEAALARDVGFTLITI